MQQLPQIFFEQLSQHIPAQPQTTTQLTPPPGVSLPQHNEQPALTPAQGNGIHNLTMQQNKWYIATIDYNKLTIADRNALLHSLRSLISQKNSMQIKDVWVTLQSGSLIINAEVEPNQPNMTWPDTREIMGAIAHLSTGSTTAHVSPTMAERSQRDTLPPRHNAWPGAACADGLMEDSMITNNPLSLGFRLVTEKSLNLKTLFGEQDPKNKIPHDKWSRQIKDFIESKGVEGMELYKAMDWAASTEHHECPPVLGRGVPLHRAASMGHRVVAVPVRRWVDLRAVL